MSRRALHSVTLSCQSKRISGLRLGPQTLRSTMPGLLTHRTEHLERLAAGLTSVEHVLVMKGGMGKKQRRAAAEALASIPEGG